MNKRSLRGGRPRPKSSKASKMQVVAPEKIPQVKAAAKRVSKKKTVAVVPVPVVVAPHDVSTKCVAQTLKKYRERPSPPYSAADCCGLRLEGNDGKLYQSVANVNGVCQWKPVKN